MDSRFFSASTTVRRRKGGAAKKLKVEQEKVKQHLLGPKTFVTERMLAIFYNLVEEPIAPTVDISAQVKRWW
jgi:origin recognition complex subunit 5